MVFWYESITTKLDTIKHYQILLPRQLVTEMLRYLHGDFGRHPGITAAIINFRTKYYYPNMPKLIRDWVKSCHKCIREKRVDNSLIRPPLQNPNEFITGPEDALQIDIVPGLPPSGVMKISLLLWMFSHDIYLLTQQQAKVQIQLPE